jgi:glucokinase
MKNKYAIGIDIGGSHISCAAFCLFKKKIQQQSFATSKLDNNAEADIIFSIWAKTIQQTIDQVGKENLLGLGFAMPGPFDYEGGTPLFTGENNKYEKLYGINVGNVLRKSLQLPDEFPIRFMNDAAAFAVGEDWIGKTMDATKSLAITLGTGLGSAFIENSLPVTSGESVPQNGCLWHLPFGIGIADDYFSSRGLINRYNEKTGNSISNVKDLAIAAQYDENPKCIFKEFGNDLSLFLSLWVKKFGVNKIVLGGNISQAAHLFLPTMKTALAIERLSSVSIDVSELGETASIIGGARLFEQDYWQKIKFIINEM